MPIRPLSRERSWMLPPTLDELVPLDHPARFVAEFVQALKRSEWATMEIAIDGDPLGAPSYDPHTLLCVWLYGFMTGVRSSRKLEGACRDQLPYLWLTGWEHPDHNTLWRFYQAHRESMRALLKRTVRVAVQTGLVDLAVQAVDGTKVRGNAAKERTYDREGLTKLLARTEATIRDLEAQNSTGGDAAPPRLPAVLAQKQALRDAVTKALEDVGLEDGPKRRNLTDPDAQLMKSRSGYVAGYNAQAMVSPLAPAAGRTGLFITGTAVSTSPADQEQLVPMIKQAQENTGRPAELTLADGGYHSGANLDACAEPGYPVAMPESNRAARPPEPPAPYAADAFVYQEETDSYTCPEGQPLRFVGDKQQRGQLVGRVYLAVAATCRACPAFGVCTKNRRQGRMLQISSSDPALRRHRTWMATPEAKAAYRQRKQLPEPTFGILKEQQDGRRFWLRGLQRVRAEWDLLATTFNLRTLARVWSTWAALRPTERGMLTGVVT